MEMGDIAGGANEGASHDEANGKVSGLISQIENLLGELKAAIGSEESAEGGEEGAAPTGEAVTVAIGKKPYGVAPRSSIRDKIAKMSMGA